MNKDDISKIVEVICRELSASAELIEMEASAKHIHLSQEHAEVLFGGKLTIDRELSQPGQYLYKERVSLIGPKNIYRDIAILGPPRAATQVELSVTDARFLGVKPVVRLSGDVAGTPGILVESKGKVVALEEGVIVAKRHIHMQPKDAEELGIKDNAVVSVEVDGDRGVAFNNIVVRVSDSFQKRLHLDYDEANAAGLKTGQIGRIKV